MKNFNQYNESIRDLMTPKSEEEIKLKMGEEKFRIYRKYNEAIDSLGEPFVFTDKPYDMFSKDDNTRSFEVRFWWVYFTIFYDGDKWSCSYNYVDNEDTFYSESWDYIYNKMKEYIRISFEKESKVIDKEIKRNQNKLVEMKKSLEIIK